jgi:adenylosuccinate synthase
VPNKLNRAKPVFTTLPGWKSDIRGITDYDQLPENAKRYVDFLEQQIEAPITMVSSGPKRSEMTYRTPKL